MIPLDSEVAVSGRIRFPFSSPGTVAIFVALVLVLGAKPVSAQVVTGVVRSGGQPVVGATVHLLELDRVELTGARGRFRFSDVPKGMYRLFVGLMGYAAATDTVRVVSDTTRASFNLVVSAIPLEGVVVTGSPTARPADEQYTPAESMTLLSLHDAGGVAFAQKISNLPGVAVRGNGSAPARPVVRGLGDNEVLVLENGLRMGDIATYDPAHATPIDAMSIQEIDVVRGPAAVLYGPSTIGGLVNLITNLVPMASDHPVSGNAALEANSVSNESSAYANTIFTTGQSALRVSAGGVHSDDIGIPQGTYRDPDSGAPFNLDRIPQSWEHAAQGGVGYSYQGGFGMVGLGSNYYRSNYGIPGVPPNPNWMVSPPTTSRIFQTRKTLEFRSLFNTSASWLERVKLNAAYNDYNHSEFPTAQDSTGVSDPQANHFHKQELNGVLRLQQRHAGHLTGTVGLWGDLQTLDISGDQPLGPNSTTTDVAAYAYEEFAATPQTRLQAGLRFDYNWIRTHPAPQSTDPVFRTSDEARYHHALTASLGLNHELSDHLEGSFSVARSFRAPTVQELFANGLDAPSGTYTIGTSSLGPETGLGVDASLKGRYQRLTFELTPYVNYINHYIYGFLRGDTIEDFPVRQFGATSARLWGYEVSLNYEPVQSVLLRGTSSYVNAEDTQFHEPLPFIPPLRGTLSATYQGPRYRATMEWRLAAAQNRLGVGDTPTAGYAVANLGAGVRLVSHGTVSEINLRCNNVFNTLYRNALSVIKDFVPQPGRGLQLDYQLLF
jgi:iron complex outermembrane receptor protein